MYVVKDVLLSFCLELIFIKHLAIISYMNYKHFPLNVSQLILKITNNSLIEINSKINKLRH